MGINVEQFYELVLKPSLKKLESFNSKINSAESRKLMLATFCHESNAGTYLKQRGGGPALGVYQIEPATAAFIQEYIRRKPSLLDVIDSSFPFWHVNTGSKLVCDLSLSTVFARIKYWTIPEPIPGMPIEALANYWGAYYQTDDSDMDYTTEKESRFIYDFQKYMIDDSFFINP